MGSFGCLSCRGSCAEWSSVAGSGGGSEASGKLNIVAPFHLCDSSLPEVESAIDQESLIQESRSGWKSSS